MEISVSLDLWSTAAEQPIGSSQVPIGDDLKQSITEAICDSLAVFGICYAVSFAEKNFST